MRKLDWNQDWAYMRLGTEDPWQPITLPFDCMLHESRSDDAAGGCNNGWFEGYDYELVKTFDYQENGLVKHRFLEFEGIYHRAEISCNGKKLAYRPNGYLGFFIEITDALKPGRNEIRVLAHGADIPSARWYTGVGIYRPVYLYEAGENYIPQGGIRIQTVNTSPAEVVVTLTTVGHGEAEVTILKDGEAAATQKCTAGDRQTLRFTIPDAKLWSPASPEMYTCRVTLGNDEAEESFGIRQVTCSPEKGLCINGQREILRGACLHHDNGLLGAVSLPEVEERKVCLLRAMGINAIRSAHNPCSKALLDACDQHGILVMDEYEDAWYIHKTKYDYAAYLQEWYERDLTDMVEKDFNHPCVVLYSLGNEVSESAEAKGVALFKKMREFLLRKDDTRPITCGINIGFNQAAAGGHSFFSDEKAFKNDFKNLGTEEGNHRKWLFGPLFTRLNALLPGCDRATRDIFAASDVAGYNYGILRYRHDHRKYPKRIILGSETFCHDAQRFWRVAHRDPAIIGDFVWTGVDHLGEVGLGAWEYKDYAPTFIHTKGWLTSGCGRIDITGKLLPEAYFMKAAYGLLQKPVIAVLPPNHTGERHSPSGWKMTNAVSSWAWEGCEGKPAEIEVYGCGAYVELFQNGKKLGRRSLAHCCRAKFKTHYQPGELLAITFDANHRELGRSNLKSANNGTRLCLEPEELYVAAEKMCFVRLRLADGTGTTRVLARDTIRVSVTGGELVALGHACPYNEDGYLLSTTSTYWGEAMAVIRAGQPGKLLVHAACKSGEAKVELNVI